MEYTMDYSMETGPTEDPLTLSPSPGTEDYDIPDMMCDRESVRLFRRYTEPPFFWLISIVGGAGNLAVVWVYLYVRRRLKTMTDVYLLNLAIADLLFLATLPLWALEALHGWSFGLGTCKLTSAFYKVNLFSSMFLLTCISVDRYEVIVRATKAQNSQGERRRRSTLVCIVVWVVSVLLSIPDMVFTHIKPVESQSFCRNVFPSKIGTGTKVWVLSMQVAMGFFLPFAVMVFCYSFIFIKLLNTRSFQKHRALRVILAVVVVFVLSQLPHNSVLVMEATQAQNATITDCEDRKLFDKVGQVLKIVAYLHACLNPFLYVFVGERFRRDLLQRLPCCRSRQTDKKQASKVLRSPRSSTRATMMSESDTSQALSL